MNKSIFNFINGLITTELPEVKYFGLYRNQFTNTNNEREIDYPAILLEIQPIQFQQELGYVQDANVTITIHVGMQIVNNIERGDKMIDNSFEYLQLLDRTWDVLDGQNSLSEYSGYTGSNVFINDLTRVSQSVSVPNKSIWYSKVDYNFHMKVAHATSDYNEHTITGTTLTYDGDLI